MIATPTTPGLLAIFQAVDQPVRKFRPSVLLGVKTQPRVVGGDEHGFGFLLQPGESASDVLRLFPSTAEGWLESVKDDSHAQQLPHSALRDVHFHTHLSEQRT